MPYSSHWAAGDNNVICDSCGVKVKASTLQKTWDGFYVCPKHWEPRHPQDFVRGVVDDMSVRINRPPPAEPEFVPDVDLLTFPPNPLGL